MNANLNSHSQSTAIALSGSHASNIAKVVAQLKRHAAAVVLGLVFSLAGGTVHAQLSNVSFSVNDGVGPYPDGSAGDTSISNQQIRTHDVAVYEIGLSAAAAGAGYTNARIELQFPSSYTANINGLFVLPSGCTNATSTDIAVTNGTVTATSAIIQRSPIGAGAFREMGSRVVCKIPALAAGGTAIYQFKFLVSGVANGSTVPLADVIVTGDQGVYSYARSGLSLPATQGGGAVFPTDLTVLAKPLWKVKAVSSGNSRSALMPKSGPRGEDGYIMKLNLILYATGSRVGLEPLGANGLALNLSVSNNQSVPFGLMNWAPAQAAGLNLGGSTLNSDAVSAAAGLPGKLGLTASAAYSSITGLNRIMGCTRSGLGSLGVPSTTQTTQGGHEEYGRVDHAGYEATAPAMAGSAALTTPTVFSPLKNSTPPTTGTPPLYSLAGFTFNPGECAISWNGTPVVHEDITNPLVKPTTGTKSFTLRFEGNDSVGFPLGHLNAVYHPTLRPPVTTGSPLASDPAYLQRLFPFYRKGALSAPTSYDSSAIGVLNHASELEPGSGASSQVWMAAMKKLNFWMPANQVGATPDYFDGAPIADATYTLTVTGAIDAASSLSMSGQANPSTALLSAPADAVPNGTLTAAASSNVVSYVKTSTVTEDIQGRVINTDSIGNFSANVGGASNVTLTRAQAYASGGYVPSLSVGKYAFLDVYVPNIASSQTFVSGMCAKIDNTKFRILSSNSHAFSTETSNNTDLALYTLGSKAAGYFGPTGAAVPNATNQRSVVVRKPYYLVEYGVRSAANAAGGFTWSTGFSPYFVGDPNRLLNSTEPAASGKSGFVYSAQVNSANTSVSSHPYPSVPAHEQHSSDCREGGITWYNTTVPGATAVYPTVQRANAVGPFINDVHTVAIPNLTPAVLSAANIPNVQYIRVRAIDMEQFLSDGVTPNPNYGLTDGDNQYGQGARSLGMRIPVTVMPTTAHAFTTAVKPGFACETSTPAAPGTAGQGNYRCDMPAGTSTNNTVGTAHFRVFAGNTPQDAADIFNLPYTPANDLGSYSASASKRAMFASTAVNIVPEPIYVGVVKSSVSHGTGTVTFGSQIRYSLTPQYLSGSSTAAVETITLHDVLPPGLSFDSGYAVTYGGAPLTAGYIGNVFNQASGVSATASGYDVYYDTRYDATGQRIAAAGYTTIVIKLYQQAYSTSMPQVFYAALATTNIAYDGFNMINGVCATSPNNTNNSSPNYTPSVTAATSGGDFLCVGKSLQQNTLTPVTTLVVNKTATPAFIEPGGAHGYRFTYTAVGGNIYRPKLIDVLPHNGENVILGRAAVPTTAGAYVLRDPSTAGNIAPVVINQVGAGATPPYRLLFTAAPVASISPSYGSPSNAFGNTTSSVVWCQWTAGGGFVRERGLTTGACPVANFANVTAFMIDHVEESSGVVTRPGTAMVPGVSYEVTVYGSSPSSTVGTTSTNTVAGCVFTISKTDDVCSTTADSLAASTRFVTGGISGKVYLDGNSNSAFDAALDTLLGDAVVRLNRTGTPGAIAWVKSNNTAYSYLPAGSATLVNVTVGSFDFSCLDNRSAANAVLPPAGGGTWVSGVSPVASGSPILWNGCVNQSRIYLTDPALGGAAEVPTTTGYIGLASTGSGVSYTLTEVQPNAYRTSTNAAGNCGGTADSATDITSGIALTTAQQCTGYYFGEIQKQVAIAKTASAPRTLSKFRFEVDYTVTVSNTIAAGTLNADVNNVKVHDNVLRAFTSGSVIPTVTISTAPVKTGAGTCTLVSSGSFTGQGAGTALVSAGTLAPQQSCIITFTATVDYGATTPPINQICYTPQVVGANNVNGTATFSNSTTQSTTGQTGCNTAFAASSDSGALVTFNLPDNPATSVTITGAGSVDASNNSASAAAGDFTPTPTRFELAVVNLAKRVVSGATQVGPNAFVMTYEYLVQNSTPTSNASNVQVSDNFVRTFTSGSTVPTITVYQPSIQTAAALPGSSCAFNAALLPAGTAQSATTQFLANGAVLAGDGTTGDSCIFQVVVKVDYGSTTVPSMTASCTTPPTTGQTGCNTAIASTALTANAGATIPNDPATSIATTTYPANSFINDLSNDGATINTTGPDVSKPTPASYDPQSLRVRKQAATPVFVPASSKFTVNYSMVVRNTGTAIASNVQMTDNLRGPFPDLGSGNPTIAITAGSILADTTLGANAATCLINDGNGGRALYNGTTITNLLPGNFNLAANEFCAVKFTAEITYSPLSTVPTTARDNSAVGGSYLLAGTANCPGASNCLLTSAPSTNQPTTAALPVAADNSNGTGVGTVTPVTLAIPGPAITKAFGAASFGSNETNTVVFTLTSASNAAGFTGIGWVDTLGSGLKWTSTTPTIAYTSFAGAGGAACSGGTASATVTAGGVLTVSGVAMPANTTSCVITITGVTNFTAGASYPASGSNACSGSAADNAYSNAGLTVTGATTTQAANSPCVTITARNITIAKAAPSPALLVTTPTATTSTYAITLTNAGSSTATGFTVTEYIPAGVNFVGITTAATTAGWTCTPTGSPAVAGAAAGATVVTCTNTTLSIAAAGSNASLEINVQLQASGLGTAVTNVAAVTTPTNTVPTFATCNVAVPPAGCAVNTTNVQTIDVVKSAGTPVQINTTTWTVPYTVKVKNNAPLGGVNATFFQVVEDLPSTFSSNSPTITWETAPALTTPSSPATATICALNAAFVTAPTNSNMFSGQQSLPPQAECVVTFNVRLVYAGSRPNTVNNSVVAKTYTTTAATAGGTGGMELTKDDSSNSATSPATPNSDTASTTPVSFVAQAVKITKSSHTVTVTSNTPSSVKVKVANYRLIVKNTGTVAANNVQVIDKLVGAGGTFEAANNVVVTNFAIDNTASTPNGTCTVNTTSPNKTYTSAASTLIALTGSNVLPVDAYCIISFDAEAEYRETALNAGDAPAQVPSTVDNMAHASLASSANTTGGSVNFARNFVSTGITGYLFTDPSQNVNVGINGGCSGASCVPTSGKGAVTPSTLAVPAIGSAKRLNTAVTQVSATYPAVAFSVPYIVRVQNTGNTTLNNVQATDDLRMPFPLTGTTAAQSISVPALSNASIVTQSASNPCTGNLNTGFNGQSSTGLTNGSVTLAAGEFCEIAFTATVTYADISKVPASTTSLPNNAFVSSTQNGPNTGHTSCTVVGQAITCTAPTGLGTVNAVDKSDSGSSATGVNTSGSANDDPTTATFAPQRVDVTKELVSSTVTSSTPLSVVLEVKYNLRVKNTGTVNATNVQVADYLFGATGSGATFAGASSLTATLGTTIPSAANTCTAGTYASSTGVLTALDGTNTLPAGEMCTVPVTVTVTYNQSAAGVDDARSGVPTSVDNTAYASSGTIVANTGGSFNATGVWTPASGTLASDVSTSVATACSGATCNPVSGDTPSATSAALSAPAMASVKSVVSTAQSGPTKYDYVFEFKLQNTGNVALNKVKLDDYLPAAFGSAATYSARTVTSTSGSCTPSTTYTGTGTTTNLLSGNDTLAVTGAASSCTIRLAVTVDFGATAIPSSMNNQAYLSATTDATAAATNAGYTFTGSGSGSTATPPAAGTGNLTPVTDKSDAGTQTGSGNNNPAGNNTGAPGHAGANTAASYDNATPLSATPQEVGVTKAVSGPVVRVANTNGAPNPVVLRVPMQVIVKNTGTIPATNVQAIDGLAYAFPAPATIVGLSSAVAIDAASTASAAVCAMNATPLNTTTKQITFMAGDQTLPAGQQCVYTFTAEVSYTAASVVPTTGVNNSVFASTAVGGTNTGGTLAAPLTAGGVPVYSPLTGPGVVTLSQDTSTNGSQAPCGTSVVAPCTGTPDAPSQTPITLAVPQLGVAKKVNTPTDAPVQVGAYAFNIPYVMVVKNTGNQDLPNVQLDDYLANAFPAPAVVTIAVAPAITGAGNHANCSGKANAAFNGAGNTKLFAAGLTLPAGEQCTVSFTAKVDYEGSTPAISLANYNNSAKAPATHNNSAFGSSAVGSNPGYTFATCAGTPSVCTPATTTTVNDKSDSGSDPVGGNPSAPGNTSASGIDGYQDATPLVFPSLNTVQGNVYFDRNSNRTFDSALNEAPLGCYLVQIYDTSVNPALAIPYLRAVTGVDGSYSIVGVPAGSNYSIRFSAIAGTPGQAGGCQLPTAVAPTIGGVTQNGTPVTTGATNNTAPAPTVRGADLPLIIAPTANGVTVVDQNLPIDPSGVVYDSITRTPISGATVDLRSGSCSGPLVTAAQLLPGYANPAVTNADGLYSFYFVNAAAIPANPVLCVTPPAAYVPSALIPSSGTLTVPAVSPFLVQPLPTAPAVGASTTYYLAFNYANPSDVINNHIPLDPATMPSLVVTKVGDKTTAAMGDTVKYTVTVKLTNVAAGYIVPAVRIVDTLPTGFKLIPGTQTLQMNSGAITTPVIAGVGPVLNVPVGSMGLNDLATITYRVRIGVGAQLGNGKNTALANTGALNSTPKTFTVVVTGGVFTSEGCVAGKVFVDCNNNHIQDKGEPGIPGVRLYMEDSTYFVTDSEGKYSYCGLTPTSHIIKVDPASLPLRARLTTSSNRNLGDAGSLMIDLRSGEFARGDFVEGSCTPSLLQEVQNRVVKDGGAQLVLPKGEGAPDVHKTLDGLVLPRPTDPKPLPGLKGVMAPAGAQK